MRLFYILIFILAIFFCMPCISRDNNSQSTVNKGIDVITLSIIALLLDQGLAYLGMHEDDLPTQVKKHMTSKLLQQLTQKEEPHELSLMEQEITPESRCPDNAELSNSRQSTI